MQPNGYIYNVRKVRGEFVQIVVKFMDNRFGPKTYVEYSIDELDGRYTNERMGYIIEPDEGEDYEFEFDPDRLRAQYCG